MTEPKIEFNPNPTYAHSAVMMEKARENEANGTPTAVYDWRFPKVLDSAVPMKTVAPNINKLRKLVVKLAAQHPAWDNEAIREFIKKKFSEFRDMADRTHPHLFLMLTDKNLTDKNFDRIKDLVAIRYLHEQNSNVEENTKLISNYFQQQFTVDPSTLPKTPQNYAVEQKK